MVPPSRTGLLSRCDDPAVQSRSPIERGDGASAAPQGEQVGGEQKCGEGDAGVAGRGDPGGRGGGRDGDEGEGAGREVAGGGEEDGARGAAWGAGRIDEADVEAAAADGGFDGVLGELAGGGGEIDAGGDRERAGGARCAVDRRAGD